MATTPDGTNILVLGEAIFDLVATAKDPSVFESATGGSSFNTALALGRLGVSAEFAGVLSSDTSGESFVRKLKDARVGMRWCGRSALPMPLALARSEPATGAVDFTLYLRGTAYEEPDALPAHWPDDIGHLHAASFRCLIGAHGEAALATMHRARGHATVSFDPNIRPSLMPPRDETMRLVEARISASTLVKASDADIAWLYPGQPLEAVAGKWLALGPQLVIITRGGDGATAIWRDGSITRAAPQVTVVDTVGAGDSFTAGLLAALMRDKRLGPVPLGPTAAAVSGWLDHANRVAALTCQRRGGEPPWLHEL